MSSDQQTQSVQDGNGAGFQWSSVTEVLQRMEGRVVADNARVDTPLARAEGLRYLTRLTVMAQLAEIEAHDPAYPRIANWYGASHQWGGNNPECMYYYACVHGDHEYRVRGFAGTPRVLTIEVWEGDMGRLRDLRTFSTLHEPHIGSGRSLEVTLGKSEQSGNHLRLPDGPAVLMLRNYFYDWENEEPTKISIERVGATYPPPPPRAEDIELRLELFVGFLDQVHQMCLTGAEQHYKAPPDEVGFAPLDMGQNTDDFGHASMAYGWGRYECGPDDAVILEVTPPECLYWQFHLTSQFWEGPLDYHVRSTTLNGHQAVLDEDGVFRAVISHRDPGVPNWLDASGREKGLLQGRYYQHKTSPCARLTTVPFAKVRDHLPASTPTVTVNERSESLRRRMLVVENRRTL